MVSKCYHKMCESCLDRLFSLGPEPCPVCGQTIRKNQFQPQIFENLDVQKEIAIRKRTAKVFNKQPDDFATIDQYNDYLEEYEAITFSLINSIGNDLAETERKIRAYEAENRNSIDENEQRLAREKELVEARERGELEWRQLEKKRYLEEEERKDRERQEERKRVLEQLVRRQPPFSPSFPSSLTEMCTHVCRRMANCPPRPSWPRPPHVSARPKLLLLLLLLPRPPPAEPPPPKLRD